MTNHLASRWAALADMFEAADGPDRTLDCLLGNICGLVVKGASWPDTFAILGLEQAVADADRYQSFWSHALPRYSASHDAIIALIREKLPGWVIETCSMHIVYGRAYGDIGSMGYINGDEDCEDEQANALGADMQIALCATFCKIMAKLAAKEAEATTTK